MGIRGRRKPPKGLDLSDAATVRLREAVAIQAPKRERAVVWLPARGADAAAQTCLDWCAHRGYEVVAVVADEGRHKQWVDVRTMLITGEADVLVTAEHSHLPEHRKPRTEFVEQQLRAAPDAPRQRRPRIVRRDK